MPRDEARINRGPAAAAGNRAALLAAARIVFAADGFHAPLHRIAKQAGVGQGVLYRHFPHRLALGLAVFEENFTELREIATDEDPGAFWALWARLIELTITDAAFVEMFVDARRTTADYDGGRQLADLLGPALQRAQAAGLADPSLSTADLLLAQRMAYGIVVTSDDTPSARAAVTDALALIERLRRATGPLATD